MFIKFVDIDWFFCVILALVCPLRACHIWLTRNHMFIWEIWSKFTSFIFEVLNLEKMNSVNLSKISLLNMWLLEQIIYTNSRFIILQKKELQVMNFWDQLFHSSSLFFKNNILKFDEKTRLKIVFLQ